MRVAGSFRRASAWQAAGARVPQLYSGVPRLHRAPPSCRARFASWFSAVWRSSAFAALLAALCRKVLWRGQPFKAGLTIIARFVFSVPPPHKTFLPRADEPKAYDR